MEKTASPAKTGAENPPRRENPAAGTENPGMRPPQVGKTPAARVSAPTIGTAAAKVPTAPEDAGNDLLGMSLFHHKTLHPQFRYGFPAILILQLILAGFLVYHFFF